MVQEKEVIAVNEQVAIGTILEKPSYYVDLWQVVKIEDFGGHWRGENNKLLTVISVHDSIHGFINFPLTPQGEFEHYCQSTLCSCRHGAKTHSYPYFDGKHWSEQPSEDTVNTYDIAEGHFNIFAKDLKEAQEKLGE